jgi:hypothetical protein
MEWQEIETAPKDAAVLVYAPHTYEGAFAVAVWYFEGWAACWPVLGEHLGFAPTHWMPLPVPPVSPTEK